MGAVRDETADAGWYTCKICEREGWIIQTNAKGRHVALLPNAYAKIERYRIDEIARRIFQAQEIGRQHIKGFQKEWEHERITGAVFRLTQVFRYGNS